MCNVIYFKVAVYTKGVFQSSAESGQLSNLPTSFFSLGESSGENLPVIEPVLFMLILPLLKQDSLKHSFSISLS